MEKYMSEAKIQNEGFSFAKNFKEAVKTNNSWFSSEDINQKRNTSSKNISETTYDRYKIYHTDYMKFTLVDKIIGFTLNKIEDFFKGFKK